MTTQGRVTSWKADAPEQPSRVFANTRRHSRDVLVLGGRSHLLKEAVYHQIELHIIRDYVLKLVRNNGHNEM